MNIWGSVTKWKHDKILLFQIYPVCLKEWKNETILFRWFKLEFCWILITNLMSKSTIMFCSQQNNIKNVIFSRSCRTGQSSEKMPYLWLQQSEANKLTIFPWYWRLGARQQWLVRSLKVYLHQTPIVSQRCAVSVLSQWCALSRIEVMWCDMSDRHGAKVWQRLDSGGTTKI